MKNYQQRGDVLTLTPAADVDSGAGNLFGEALFGVATGDVAANTPGEFQTTGVVVLPKTSALAINVGDRVFWNGANKLVNKTAAAQFCVGVAVEAAANPSPTVAVKLGAVPAVAA